MSVVQWSLRFSLPLKAIDNLNHLKLYSKRKIRKKQKETNHQRLESSILNLIHVEFKHTNLTHFTIICTSKTGVTTVLLTTYLQQPVEKLETHENLAID